MALIIDENDLLKIENFYSKNRTRPHGMLDVKLKKLGLMKRSVTSDTNSYKLLEAERYRLIHQINKQLRAENLIIRFNEKESFIEPVVPTKPPPETRRYSTVNPHTMAG